MNPQNDSKWTAGRISLILFGSFAVLWLFTAVLTYIPRDNDFRSELTWLGIFVGFGFFFWAIPLLVLSLVTGIVSLAKDRGPKEGLIAVICNLTLFIGVFAWLLFK